MKRFKVWLLLGLVFVAGFVGGIVVTRIVVRHFVREAIARPELVQKRLERELNRKLRLDSRQREQVDAILRDAHVRFQQLRRDFQPQLAGILQTACKDISAVLTPEQQERFEKFQAENRAILQAR